jgi:hypothetical protein
MAIPAIMFDAWAAYGKISLPAGQTPPPASERQ